MPIVWGPTPSRVATTALLGSRSQASTIFARNVSTAGSECDRVMAKRWVRSSLDIVSLAFGRPVRILQRQWALSAVGLRYVRPARGQGPGGLPVAPARADQ